MHATTAVPSPAPWHDAAGGSGQAELRVVPGTTDALRAVLAPPGRRLLVAVGPLAAEAGADALPALGGLAGTRLVALGHGPQRDALAVRLPDALLLGGLEPAAEDAVLRRADVAVVLDPGAPLSRVVAVTDACRGCPVVVVRDVVGPRPPELVRRGVTVVLPGAWGDLRAAVRSAVAAGGGGRGPAGPVRSRATAPGA